MHNAAEADNERDKQVSFVCGLYIAKTIAIPDISHFVCNYVPSIPYTETFRKIEELGKQDENDDEL